MGQPASSIRAIVRRLLIQLVEDEGVALRIVEDALASAGRHTMPSDPVEMHSFVRAHLLGPLTTHIGPRLASAFLEELALEAAAATPSTSQPSMQTISVTSPRPGSIPSSRPVSSRPVSSRPGHGLTVVLIDGDRFRRATTSRALVGAGFDVAVVDTPDELRPLATGCSLVLAALGAPTVPSLVAAALASFPGARALVRAHDLADAARSFIDVKDRVEVALLSATTGELVEQVLRVACA
jgi:hypothetical protein